METRERKGAGRGLRGAEGASRRQQGRVRGRRRRMTSDVTSKMGALAEGQDDHDEATLQREAAFEILGCRREHETEVHGSEEPAQEDEEKRRLPLVYRYCHAECCCSARLADKVLRPDVRCCEGGITEDVLCS